MLSWGEGIYIQIRANKAGAGAARNIDAKMLGGGGARDRRGAVKAGDVGPRERPAVIFLTKKSTLSSLQVTIFQGVALDGKL